MAECPVRSASPAYLVPGASPADVEFVGSMLPAQSGAGILQMSESENLTGRVFA